MSNDLKMPNKKGLEFDGLKNSGQIVKKIWELVDVGISDDQQQQTESTLSSTDTCSQTFCDICR